ncbi:AAA family ATPase [Actinoplanes sp. L3-i22]|uniref:ATP-binding protein n=1 Tax=Actinoplanes sp. L3-i22 TaxID=2836373 RepID=UPI001C74318B|nr:AAA family ATPase [Actinoplanes sp. L3-i22]BCY13248.1 LuxR family transcriptional regulator [Actinoplanes sp. L3-i22]
MREPLLAASLALPSATGPFVGRAELLAELHAELTKPYAMILLIGEAGVGKTRLVAEALAGSPVPVVVAHCDDLREPQPLGPLLDGLRLKPPLVTGPPLDPDADRARLLRAMAALLRERGPLVVALEDLQMADPATLDLIDHLAAHPVPGLTILMTMRDPDAVRPLPAAVRRLPVGPLGRDEVGALAASLLARHDPGAEPPGRFVTHLYERTAGIPFLVEEVMRTLVTDGDVERIQRHPEALGDIPALLRDVLQARLSHLGENAREILGAAAAIGPAADPRPIAAVLGVDDRTVAVALGAARDAGLLHELDGRLWFRHTLARQVVYELVPPTARRLLHLRTARLLEEQKPRPVTRLAHHYRLAGSAADHVRNAEVAADLAAAQGDDATAARFLLETTGYPDLPRPVRVRLAAKLACSAIESVAQADAIPVLRRLLADRRLPPGARGELGLALGRMLRQQGEAREGYDEIERAVPYLRQHGRRARALAVLSAPDTVVGRHVTEHQRLCAEAAAEAELSGDPQARLAVLIARLSLALETGDPAAEADIAAALAGQTFAGRPRERARACLNWAQGALHTDRTALAARLLDIGRRLVDDADYERLRPVVELTEFGLDLAAGRHDGLRARLLHFLDRPYRLPLAMADARLYLARLGGDEPGLRAVVAEATRTGAVWPLVPARTALAALLIAAGRADEGRAEARAALELATGKGLRAWGAEAARMITSRPARISRP